MIYLCSCVDVHYTYNIKENKFYRCSKISLDSYDNSYRIFVYVSNDWFYEGHIHNVKFIPETLSCINERISNISDLESLLLSKILDNI